MYFALKDQKLYLNPNMTLDLKCKPNRLLKNKLLIQVTEFENVTPSLSGIFQYKTIY